MSDDIFRDLKLWQDKNSNGLVDNDEFYFRRKRYKIYKFKS